MDRGRGGRFKNGTPVRIWWCKFPGSVCVLTLEDSTSDTARYGRLCSTTCKVKEELRFDWQHEVLLSSCSVREKRRNDQKLLIFDQYFPLNQSHWIQLATYILFTQQLFFCDFFWAFQHSRSSVFRAFVGRKWLLFLDDNSRSTPL